MYLILNRFAHVYRKKIKIRFSIKTLSKEAHREYRVMQMYLKRKTVSLELVKVIKNIKSLIKIKPEFSQKCR